MLSKSLNHKCDSFGVWSHILIIKNSNNLKIIFKKFIFSSSTVPIHLLFPIFYFDIESYYVALTDLELAI